MRLEVIGWALAASAIVPSLGNGADGDRRAQVDAIFAGYQRTDSPGCALGIFREGDIEYARGYGMANLELGVAITPSTVFDIGSTEAVLGVRRPSAGAGQEAQHRHEVRRYVPSSHYGPITVRT
jgi:hypothetical protein